MPLPRWKASLSAIAAIATAFALGAPASMAQGKPGGAPPPPPEVSYIVTQERSIPIEFEFLGVTAPSKMVEVRARIRGFLKERHFEEGTKVEKGAPLYSIDKASFEADMEVAEARVQQAEARLELADRERTRLDTLRKTGAIPQGDYDKALSEFLNARAALRLAEADQHKAQLELSYTEIAAPIGGMIGKTRKEVGSLVDAMENSFLTTITTVSPIYLSLRVSESEYIEWKHDTASGKIVLREGYDDGRFLLVLPDGEVFPEEGKSNFQDSAFDPRTGTFEVRAEFPNKDGLLKAGQFARARIVGWERPGVIAVPQRSVFQSPAGAFVYVIGEGDKIGFRPVKPGAWSGHDWIIESGLKAGERVLVEGFLKARPGSPVTPVLHVPPADSDGGSAPAENASGKGA